MKFSTTDRSASARVGVRWLAVALATVAIVAAGCGGAASTSAPSSDTSATSAAVATDTAATPTEQASVTATKTAAGSQLNYALIVAAAKLEVDGNVAPSFDSVKFSVDSLFTGTPSAAPELDKAAMDALLVKFAGTDKAAALVAGETLFKSISDALHKLNIASDEVLAGIYACGQVNIPGWKDAMDAIYAKS